jgi:hypothetical protein
MKGGSGTMTRSPNKARSFLSRTTRGRRGAAGVRPGAAVGLRLRPAAERGLSPGARPGLKLIVSAGVPVCSRDSGRASVHRRGWRWRALVDGAYSQGEFRSLRPVWPGG